MGLYLGSSEKVKIVSNSEAYHLFIHVNTNKESNIRLLSFDNYILKDSNGLYLTVKESE